MTVLLMFVPGVLYQTMEQERPEETESSDLHFRLTEEIARALTSELNNRGLFKTVTYLGDGTQGDLVLRGLVTTSKAESTLYQYGLTVLGVLVGYVGAPIGSYKPELGITLRLEEPQSQSVLWEKSHKTQRDIFVSLYYGTRSGYVWYDVMLKELMPQILSDLETAIKNITSASAERTQAR